MVWLIRLVCFVEIVEFHYSLLSVVDVIMHVSEGGRCDLNISEMFNLYMLCITLPASCGHMLSHTGTYKDNYCNLINLILP